ncbi:MAG: cupin domain-containing protein [Planctomycetota bacterium]
MKTHQLVRKDDGRDFDYSQDHCFVKLASQETKGELCFVEDHLKPGFKLGRHHHKIMTEVFYILEGEVTFQFDDETITLVAGDTLTVPPNAWHAASCESGGRMLTIFKNGRFDEYLERLSGMTDAQFQDAELMKSVAAEFDIYEE